MEIFPKCIRWVKILLSTAEEGRLLPAAPKPRSACEAEGLERPPPRASASRPVLDRIAVCAKVSPCFRLSVRPSALLRPVRRMAPGPLHCYLSPAGRGQGPQFYSTKGAHTGQLPCVGHWEGPTGYEGQKLAFLSLLHVDKCQNTLSFPW